MTRDEARQLYGEPFHRSTLAGGECWLYRLKFDEVYGRAKSFVWQRRGSCPVE